MKHKLLDLIKAGRDKEESDLLPYVNDAPADEPGRWTAKDQLAHLTAWRQVVDDEIYLARTGGAAAGVSANDTGRWMDKDQLANITAWRQVSVAEMDAVRTGGPPPDVSDDHYVENAYP